MWFDELMDDCKQALVTANRYKSIFIPIFLKLALSIGIFIYVFVSSIATIFKFGNIFDNMYDNYFALAEILPGILINAAIIYLLFLVGYSILDVGSINMYKTALEDRKPGFKDFTAGIKAYFFKVLLGHLFLSLIMLITLPVTAFLFIIFGVLAGILVPGWSLIFLSVLISVYLGAWISIAVIDGHSPLTAMVKSIKLGSRNFKELFILLLAASLITSYAAVIFGVLAAVVAGWFIAGVAATYFQLVVILIYYRNRENI